MPIRTRMPRRRVVALFWTTLLALPVAAPAQQAASREAQNAAAEKRVSLDVEDVRLVTAIRLLMQSAQADYTIDNALRGATVTAHLTNVRLRTALDALLRAGSVPATYRYEDGIYNFLPRVETTLPAELSNEPPADETPAPRLATIRVNFVSPALIATLLGGTAIDTLGQIYGLVNTDSLLGGFVGLGGPGANPAAGPPQGNPGPQNGSAPTAGNGNVLIGGPTSGLQGGGVQP